MSNRAWVTLATNDSYGLGALVLAHSLRRVGSGYPAVVLLTPAVTEAMRDRLRGVFAEVVLVDVLDSRDAAHLALLQRPELGITFTKIHCWTLTQYEKCVFLDADTLVVQNCDELFDREELSAAPDVGWPDCFNSGVFVYKPSNETFEALVRFAQDRGSFDGGDQGLLNSFFLDWARGDPNKRLPFLYNVTSAAFYSYIPALKQFGRDMKIIHFIGASKPWLQTFNWETRTVSAPDHLRDLLQLWWDLFVSQVHSHLDTTMSGVAGNLARVSPDNIGSQREALDELSRRQGWEAGNIDYMGADSFANIWAKISQTLSQPRSSPPKQVTPPLKEPTPPKQPTPPKDLSASTQTEITQSEQTEQSELTSAQQEVDAPALAAVTDIVAQAVSELEAESKVIEAAKSEGKLEFEAIKPELEPKEVLDTKEEIATCQSDIIEKLEENVLAQVPTAEPEITAGNVIAVEAEKLTPEAISNVENIPKDAAKAESDIVQRESTIVDASNSVSETSAPSEILSTPQSSVETKSEKAVSDSTQVAQPTEEIALQPVQDIAEIPQADAPVDLPADIPSLPAPATEAPVVASANIEVSSPIASPVTTEVSTTVETSTKEVSTLIEAPAMTETSPTTETSLTTEAPTTTEVPATTEIPITTEAPTTTEVPATTEIPITAEVTPTTETSATTEASATTEIPASTEVPKTTEAPPTEAPSTTEAPATTEASVTTETSAPTEALVSTEAPAPTDAPAPTEAPASAEPISTEALGTKEKPAVADVSTPCETSVKTETSAKEKAPEATEVPVEIPVTTDVSAELSAAKEIPENKSTEGSVCEIPSTPDKTLELSKDSASDSPPLATTPAKEEQPPTAAKSGAGAEGDGERAARRPAQHLQLVTPTTAAPLTPDSELEDAAALAQSIIASELATPTVTAPTPPLPTPASPPLSPVSLAQIGVKPSAKEKTTTAAHIASSVSETKDTGTPKKKAAKSASVKPDQSAIPLEPPTPSSPAETSEPASSAPKEEPVKKKVIVKKVKKEGATAETPVPPPRKKEKKPK